MADVTVKMGVSGVAQFKTGMTEAQAAVKTFDAALKANEKQLKATGNAENYMQAQTTLLNGKLKEQEKIAKNAEQALKQMEANGVKTTSKSYQDMQRKLIEAQSAMLDTQMELDGLGTKAADATGKTDKLGDSLGGLNKKISLDQDEFQRMQKLVTNGLDTSVDALLNAQSKLNKNIGKGNKETMDTMRELGLLFSTGKGEEHLITEDSVELFWKAGQALMQMEDAFDKEAAAQAMFGRSWKELIPLFTEYKSLDEYNAALAEQNVVSEDTVKSLAELNDEVGKLIGDFETLKTETIGALAPALTAGAEALDGLLSRILEYLKTPEGQQALDDLGKAVEGLFSDLSSIDPEAVVQGFSDVFNKIVGGVQWIVDNKDTVVGALEAIVIGWGALKITGGALEIVKLIQGIQGLTAGSAAAAAGEAGAAAGASWGGAFASAVLKAAPWLLFLYETLKPSGSATDNLDLAYANGQVTEAGYQFWNNNMDQWENRLGAVGNRYGDLGTLVNTPEALNIIANPSIDDEEVFRQLEETLGLKPVDVNVDPVVGENAAADIAEQIGTVEINGVVHFTDENGNNIGVTSDFFGTGEPTGKVRKPTKKLPGHANGLYSVPFDGYTAVLHKDERIVPAREVAASRNYNSNLYVESMYMNNGTDAAGLAAAMAAAQRRTMRGYGS